MKEKNRLSILFIGKKDDVYSSRAAAYLQQHFEDPVIVFSSRSMPFPDDLLHWRGDLIISYLAQWIIPATLLNNASIAAVNLHPGPPEYPGIGCTNFAIYNGEKEFGITCHHMNPGVDSGKIINVRRFPVYETDTVYTITQRCYAEILQAFYELMDLLLSGKALPASDERWTRLPFRRKQLDKLCEILPDMDNREIEKRLRATTYGSEIWAYVIENGIRIPWPEFQKNRQNALNS